MLSDTDNMGFLYKWLGWAVEWGYKSKWTKRTKICGDNMCKSLYFMSFIHTIPYLIHTFRQNMA